MSFTEVLLIKSALADKAYLASIANSVEVAYISTPAAADIFEVVSNFFGKYDDIPTQDIIVNEVDDEDKREDVVEFLTEVNSIEFDVAKQYEYLVDKTDEWLKEKAIKQAVLKSIEVIDSKDEDDYTQIREYVEKALVKTIKFDLSPITKTFGDNVDWGGFFGLLDDAHGALENHSDTGVKNLSLSGQFHN